MQEVVREISLNQENKMAAGFARVKPTLDTRPEKRTPLTLQVKFKAPTLDNFIERYGVDISHGGIFIRTKEPLEIGTQLRFEFQLQDASPLISGEGTIVWTREFDPSQPEKAPGMGIRFDRLTPESQESLDKILAKKPFSPSPAGRSF